MEVLGKADIVLCLSPTAYVHLLNNWFQIFAFVILCFLHLYLYLYLLVFNCCLIHSRSSSQQLISNFAFPFLLDFHIRWCQHHIDIHSPSKMWQLWHILDLTIDVKIKRMNVCFCHSLNSCFLIFAFLILYLFCILQGVFFTGNPLKS